MSFGNELVKSLKIGVVSRGRTSGAGKNKGHRKNRDAGALGTSTTASIQTPVDANARPAELWGLIKPVSSTLNPIWSGNIAILLIGILLYLAFFRTPSTPSVLSHDVGCSRSLSLPQRLAAYEEMWRREESELWNWLEDRAGMDGIVFPTLQYRTPEPRASRRSSQLSAADERDLMARLRDEKFSDQEMDHALRTTRQQLDILERMMNNRKAQRTADSQPIQTEL